MPPSSRDVTALLSKKRKEIDDNSTIFPDGDKKKPSYEELEMKLLDSITRVAELEKVIEDLKAQTGNAEDDVSDDEMEEIDASDPWNAKYLQLRYYCIENGHCNVKRNDRNLGVWVKNQKTMYRCFREGKRNATNAERIAMLEGLGMNWGTKYDAPVPWEARFDELVKFKKAMGHCNIPESVTHPSPIAMWVSAQRQEFKRYRKGRDSLLNLEQIEKLNGIGFNWKSRRGV
jgi:hypothetical protein